MSHAGAEREQMPRPVRRYPRPIQAVLFSKSPWTHFQRPDNISHPDRVRHSRTASTCTTGARNVLNHHRRLAEQSHLDHAFTGDVKVLKLRRLITPLEDSNL